MKLLKISLFACFMFVNLVYSLEKSKDCKCKIQANKRIIGGRIAHHTDYPWTVSISTKPQFPESIRKIVPEQEKVKAHVCG